MKTRLSLKVSLALVFVAAAFVLFSCGVLDAFIDYNPESDPCYGKPVEAVGSDTMFETFETFSIDSLAGCTASRIVTPNYEVTGFDPESCVEIINVDACFKYDQGYPKTIEIRHGPPGYEMSRVMETTDPDVAFQVAGQVTGATEFAVSGEARWWLAGVWDLEVTSRFGSAPTCDDIEVIWFHVNYKYVRPGGVLVTD